MIYYLCTITVHPHSGSNTRQYRSGLLVESELESVSSPGETSDSLHVHSPYPGNKMLRVYRDREWQIQQTPHNTIKVHCQLTRGNLFLCPMIPDFRFIFWNCNLYSEQEWSDPRLTTVPINISWWLGRNSCWKHFIYFLFFYSTASVLVLRWSRQKYSIL